MPTLFRPLRLLSLALATLVLVACGGDDPVPPGILPVAPRTIAVNETLSVELVVRNPQALPLIWRVVGPDLPGFDRVATVSGDPSRGEFRWTPLVSHVGTHSVTFAVTSSEGTSQTTTTITVTPASDSAPVFLRPGAGATFDLTSDPCVNVDIEVRDDDSATVTIGPRSILPEGATIEVLGPKTAALHWCPAPDQIAASERWTLALSANDGDHPATAHDFVAVLRAGARTDCPGADPVVALVAPLDAERVTTSAGFDVIATASDVEGLRDAPLLYWTTTLPDDLTKPDITLFSQLSFTADGAQFRARLPLSLAEGAEQTVWLLASATDNDDPTGTLCDHRSDTPLISVVAVGGAGGGTLALCTACTASLDCESGVCATGASGGRCLAACTGAGASCAAGSCLSVTRIEGTTASACGDVTAACSAVGVCVDDTREENDNLATATLFSSAITNGVICPGDSDWFRVDAAANTRVDVTLDGFVHSAGDLDLQVVSSTGAILASSAGTTNVETAGVCMAAPGALYARVFGYGGAAGPAYGLRVATASEACCVDDTFEPDDTRLTARAGSAAFDGTVCPNDDDYLYYDLTAASTLTATLVFDATADLDIELYGPDGTVVAASRGVTDTETFTADVTPGRYALRVFGYAGASSSYVGEVTIVARTSCTTTLGCPTGMVCNGSVCVAGACTSAGTCPSLHACPVSGPTSAGRLCTAPCTLNADCRSNEACKWFAEGRYCGVRGAAANGAACTSYADCGGQRACLATAGGYCARAGCTRNSDCETGTFCATVGTANVCALSCLTSDSVCRLSEGYACRSVTDVAGTAQRLCVP
jgi:PKD repeat protein